MLRKGEMVRCVREENEYSGWYFCEKGGIQGWVPADLVELVEDMMGRIKEDYSSKELTIETGDMVVGHRALEGWVCGKKVKTGDEGWVPFSSLEEIISAKI